jgi:hypothetical protein
MSRLLRALRRPAHIGWGGDYRGDQLFVPCWNPWGSEVR